MLPLGPATPWGWSVMSGVAWSITKIGRVLGPLVFVLVLPLN